MSWDVYQDEVWTDADENEHVIADMDPRHARNAARFLERHADQIALADSWRMFTGPQPSGEAAQDCLEMALLHDEARKLADVVGWLRETPLLEALIARGKQGPPTTAELFGLLEER